MFSTKDLQFEHSILYLSTLKLIQKEKTTQEKTTQSKIAEIQARGLGGFYQFP